MKSMLSDQELLALFTQGDNSAMDEIINRYHKKVYYYIRHLVRKQELAEDLCQETFVKIINSLKKENYHDDGHLSSWIMRIAHNLVIDHFRKENKIPIQSNESREIDLFNNVKFSEENIEQKLSKTQIQKDLKELIKLLPEDQRSTVIMRLKLDMSFKEIANIQGISINTALGRMRYAILNLRKMIQEKQLVMSV